MSPAQSASQAEFAAAYEGGFAVTYQSQDKVVTIVITAAKMRRTLDRDVAAASPVGVKVFDVAGLRDATGWIHTGQAAGQPDQTNYVVTFATKVRLYSVLAVGSSAGPADAIAAAHTLVDHLVAIGAYQRGGPVSRWGRRSVRQLDSFIRG